MVALDAIHVDLVGVGRDVHEDRARVRLRTMGAMSVEKVTGEVMISSPSDERPSSSMAR